jgi:hypothetical protein
VRLVPEILAIPRRGFGVLVDRHRDGLDVEVAPPFPRRQAAHRVQRDQIQAGSAHRRTTAWVELPSATSEGLSGVGTWLLGFELIALNAKGVDFVEYPLQRVSAEAVEMPAR